MFDVSSVCATTMTSSSLKSLLLSSAWVQKMLYNMLTLYCPGVGSRPGLDHERVSVCPVVCSDPVWSFSPSASSCPFYSDNFCSFRRTCLLFVPSHMSQHTSLRSHPFSFSLHPPPLTFSDTCITDVLVNTVCFVLPFLQPPTTHIYKRCFPPHCPR